MIDYMTILKAKNGDEAAINKIIKYYMPSIKKHSKDEDFIQFAIENLIDGIHSFKNKNKKI